MRDRVSGLILSLPAMVLMVPFFIAPLVLAVIGAFLRFDIRMNWSWAGLDNFRAIFGDVGLRALGVTLLFGVCNVVLAMSTSVLGGLAVAQFPGRWWSIYQVAAMFTGLNTSILWLWMFSPVVAGANQFLRFVGLPDVMWHSTPWAARLAVILVIWCWQVPSGVYNVAVAIRATPQELLEAARIEGATRWQEFRYVIAPVVRKPLTLIVLGYLTALLLVYTAPVMLWYGGPLGSTTTALMRGVEWAGKPGMYGMAAAMSLLVLVATTPVCLAAWRIGNRKA